MAKNFEQLRKIRDLPSNECVKLDEIETQFFAPIDKGGCYDDAEANGTSILLLSFYVVD